MGYRDPWGGGQVVHGGGGGRGSRRVRSKVDPSGGIETGGRGRYCLVMLLEGCFVTNHLVCTMREGNVFTQGPGLVQR